MKKTTVNVANALFISPAGADLAEKTKQRELFLMVDLETKFMNVAEEGKMTARSKCIIRGVFHAEV